MSELFDILKSSLPALVFFCVGAAFALFFLVLVFFYIAKEKKPRNAFDITATVINSVALFVSVIIGLCAVFYRFPVQKVSVSGEYTAAFDIFGLEFTVSGFGAVLKFICGAYGISLYATLLFALVLFAIIHPLRILRKKAALAGAETFSSLDETEPLISDTETDGDTAGETERTESDDALIDELSEENISDKIDEIVTRAQTEISSSDDVSPYMISENDVSDVLEMLSDENEKESKEEPKEEPISEEFREPEEAQEPEKSEETVEEPEEIEKAAEEEPSAEKKKPEHAPKPEYVIPVTVRTIIRRKPAAETATQETQKEQKREPEKKVAETAPKKTAGKQSAAKNAAEETAATAIKIDATPPREVEAKQIPSLPVGRRYVVQNRRNVVNMFNDYLNSKEKDEKEKLANSLNTIILK